MELTQDSEADQQGEGDERCYKSGHPHELAIAELSAVAHHLAGCIITRLEDTPRPADNSAVVRVHDPESSPHALVLEQGRRQDGWHWRMRALDRTETIWIHQHLLVLGWAFEHRESRGQCTA